LINVNYSKFANFLHRYQIYEYSHFTAKSQ